MSDPQIARELVRLVNQVFDQRLGEAFGGSPGVYTNVHLTIDRRGFVRFAQGGGEVAIDFPPGGGTVHYVAPYAMTFGTVITHTSGGSVTLSYAAPASSTFGGTATPVVMAKGGCLRVVASGVGPGATDYLAAVLVRLAPGGSV